MYSGSQLSLPFKNCFINHHLSFLHYQPFSFLDHFNQHTHVHLYLLSKKKILHLNPHPLHLPSYFYALLYSQSFPRYCLHLLYTFSHLPLTLQFMSVWICPVTPLKWLSRLPTLHIAKSWRHVSFSDLSVAFDKAYHLFFLKTLPLLLLGFTISLSTPSQTTFFFSSTKYLNVRVLHGLDLWSNPSKLILKKIIIIRCCYNKNNRTSEIYDTSFGAR